MKQAFLITAYKDFESLYELAAFLVQTSYVYVHVDSKSEITSAQIGKLNALKGCHAVKKYCIFWGGFKHVTAILDLLGQAVLNEEVSYIHLLTGEDLPLKTMQELDAAYVEENRIFMDCIQSADFSPQVWKRCLYYNLFADCNVKNPFLWQLQDMTVRLQRLVGIRRKKIGEFPMERLWKGLVYISMPVDAARYVVSYCEENTDFLADLRKCQIPEEFLFQTLLMNSSFAKRVCKHPIRYMNWQRGDGGSPAYLELADLEPIRQGNYDFARKFGKGISDELRDRLFMRES